MIVDGDLKLFSYPLGPFTKKKCITIDHEPCHLPAKPWGLQNCPFNDHPSSLIGQRHQLRILMFVEIKDNAHKKKYDKETREFESDRNEKREGQCGSDSQKEGKEKGLMRRKPSMAQDNSAKK